MLPDEEEGYHALLDILADADYYKLTGTISIHIHEKEHEDIIDLLPSPHHVKAEVDYTVYSFLAGGLNVMLFHHTDTQGDGPDPHVPPYVTNRNTTNTRSSAGFSREPLYQTGRYDVV